MKKRKLLCTILAMAMCMTAVFGMLGCKPNERDGSSVYISASLAGYRRQWLDGIAEKYKAQTGINVVIDWDSSLTTNYKETFETGYNLSDIYYINMAGGSSEFVMNLKGQLAPLNDVFAKDNGAGKTIEESILDGFEGAGVYNGTRFAIYTMAGYDCLVYNPDILTAAGWDKPFPATVDGLIEMFEVVNKANLKASDGTTVKPFVYTGIYSSISHMFDAFEVQYGGTEEYAEFYTHTDKSKPNDALYNKKSTEVAFENLKKIMAVNADGIPKYVLPGCASMTHTDAQTAFLNGYAAVCTTGTWFETEMEQIIEPTDKYEIAPFPLAADENGGFGEAEKHLIDPNGPKTPENMMKYIGVGFAGSPFIVPKEAENVQGAKDFLAFMLREENIRYMHEQTGNSLRFEYDKTGLQLNDWAQQILENDKITLVGLQGASNPLYFVGALGASFRTEVWVGIASNKNFDYKAAMETRLGDVKHGWAEKVELI